MTPLRVIIVDDERIAREEVKRHLAPHADFEVVAESKNSLEAKKQIEALQPDLVFLDIQMPGGTGFSLLESLDVLPHVVFTTAYSEYAVDAFEIDALDYLVKPLRTERFIRTIERIRKKFAEPGNSKAALNKQLFIKDGNRCHFVKINEIELIESLDNYARIYYGNRSACIKRSLNQLEETLDAGIFFRINRAYIVNTNFIRQIHTSHKGQLIVSMENGQELEVSTRQSVKFKSLRKI